MSDPVSYDDLARILKLPVGTVRSRLKRTDIRPDWVDEAGKHWFGPLAVDRIKVAMACWPKPGRRWHGK